MSSTRRTPHTPTRARAAGLFAAGGLALLLGACAAPVEGPDPDRTEPEAEEPLTRAAGAARDRAARAPAPEEDEPVERDPVDLSVGTDPAGGGGALDRSAAWRGVLGPEALDAPPVEVPPAPADGTTVRFEPDEEQLLRLLERGDPALVAAERRLDAALEGYDQVAWMGDLVRRLRAFTRTATPVVGGPPMAAGDRVPQSALAPWPSIEALRGDLARRSAELAFEGWRAGIVDHGAQVLRLTAELRFVDAERAVHEGHLALIDELIPVATSGLAAGRTRQSDVLTLEAERERLLGRVEELAAARDGLQRSLLARLGLDAGADPGPVVWAPRPGVAPAGDARGAGDAGDAGDAGAEPEPSDPPPAPAPGFHPALGAARARRDRAAAALRLAEVMTLGPTDLGTSRFERGLRGEASVARPGVGPGAAPPPPTASSADFGAREALLRELRLAWSAADEAARAVARDLEGRRARADASWREAATRRRVALEEVLPRERATYEGLRGAWSGGAASFLDVYQAARRVLDVELTVARARRDLGLARAERLAATGHRPGTPVPEGAPAGGPGEEPGGER